jgi:hypothetical protein
MWRIYNEPYLFQCERLDGESELFEEDGLVFDDI